MVMRVARLIRHAAATHWRARMLFPSAALDAIQQAIARVDATHAGEIRFAIETALPPLHVLNGVSPRARAQDVFAHLRVWDTEHNNGVLIYLLLADRSVDIVADRGFDGRISPAEWESVCRLMEEHYRAGRFQAGSIAGVEAIGSLLARHFPPQSSQNPQNHNQLPDRPTLL
jgi:uncharacterized membrane protein